MFASNADGDEKQEAFLVSKYDLVRESLADMVQVSCHATLAWAGGGGILIQFLVLRRTGKTIA